MSAQEVDWPSVSIVTPAFNSVRFIRATIRSILGQAYPSLDYIVMDGGSTDGSVEIIRDHESSLRWVSQADAGQYDGIQKGFERSSGEIMGWLNSDDIYLPGTLWAVGRIFRDFPEIEWITTRFPMAVDEQDAPIKVNFIPGFSRERFRRGDFFPTAGWDALGFIQQESTFWRRSLWEKAGGRIDTALQYAGDFELWSRFFEHAELYGVDVPLGCFRRHGSQKTSVAYARYLDEARSVFAKVGGVPPSSPARQRWRMRSMISPSDRLRSMARRVGLIDSTPVVTYDWGSASWSISRR